MAYGLRYLSEFYNTPPFKKLVSVQIHKKDYSGAVTNVRTTSVTIENNYTDDNTPLIGKGAKIVIAINQDELSDIEEMLVSYEKQYLCIIEYNTEVVFMGFSICDLNERQLLPYAEVTMQFTNYVKRLEDQQLGCLSNMSEVTGIKQIIDTMINLTELDLPLYVNSTLFENDMNQGASDSFLPQVYVQNAQFYTDSFSYDNAYDTINKTLLSFSAFMYMHKEAWFIERLEDVTRTGDWVLYSADDSAPSSSTPSLRQQINKQDNDFSYVDMSQIIEYDSGLQKLIIKLHDKIFETLVFNDWSTDMNTVSDISPDAGTLEKKTWYRHEDTSNIIVGANHRGMMQYVRYDLPSTGDATTFYKGMYYCFELQFNSDSDETTELTVSYKMSGYSADPVFTSRLKVTLSFLIRIDGGPQSGNYLVLTDTGNWMIIPPGLELFNSVEIDQFPQKTLQWSLMMSGGLDDIWDDLGNPETQKFIIMFFPIRCVGTMQATKWLTTNYLGDIAVTVNEKESLENKIEYHLNENFIKTEEVELFLFDLNNINYSNGLLGADKETLTNLWTSENSVMERPLYEIFAMCKFRKYGRTIHRLKGTILTDIVLKPFCIITDDNLQRGGQNMKFLLNHFTWDLNRGTYDIEAEEYSEEDVTVDGVTYDSEGNPEVITPVAPTNLSLIKYEHFGAILASWNPVGGSVIGYKLQRKPYYSPLTSSWVDSYITVYTGTSNVYFDTPGMLIGTTFSYRVCAYNAEGDGPYSAVETITW